MSKLKIYFIMFAVLCFVSANLFAAPTTGGKKGAKSTYQQQTEKNALRQKGGIYFDDGSSGPGTGGASTGNSLDNNNNNSSSLEGEACDPNTDDKYCDDENGGPVYDRGPGSGIVDERGCNDTIDTFIKNNKTSLSKMGTNFVKDSCDFNNNCTAHAVVSTGKKESHSWNYHLERWTFKVQWNLIANGLNFDSADKWHEEFDCAKSYKGKNETVDKYGAGYGFRHGTWFRSRISRIYVKRCCPNVMCGSGGYYDFKLKKCQHGKRPTAA